MKKFNLFLIFFMTTSRLVLGQMDINAVNKPVELLNSANEDIENGNYTDAVQKLLAAIRLEPGNVFVPEHSLFPYQSNLHLKTVFN